MSLRRFTYLFAAAVGLSAGLAAPAVAKDVNWGKVREASRKGPFTIDLREKVTLRVPTGFRLVTEDKLTVFHELMGDAPLPEEAGVLITEEGGWVAVIVFPKEDPLKGQDPRELNTDALLKWNEKELDDAQPKRTALNLPGLKITGWTHKPAYDVEGKRLTMGMRVTKTNDRSDGKNDELYYKTLIYGPDGVFVCLHTITGFGNWDKPLEETKKLAGEFTYPQAAAEEGDDPMYVAKIGGAGLIGVIAVIFAAKLLGGRRPDAVQQSRAARRFGTPR